MRMEVAPLPLFPLHTVLFPGGPLALRIFEARYLDMVRRCMKEHQGFGVVTIFEGGEAGAVARLATLGTCARIVDFDPLPDGLLGITCIGGERVRILRRWQQPDGLHLAEVQRLAAPAPCELPAEFAHLADLLREVLPRLGPAYAHVDAHFEDAGWVADRWAEILPLQPQDKLVLLELDEPLGRLAQVAAWSARQPPAAHV
jgi:Lon protease-like protein